MDTEKIAGFYDGFSARQYKTGLNERLISLYERCKHWGLKKDSSVLELGCGVGIFSKLLLKTVKNGKIEAVDLSPKSIEIAQKHIQGKNLKFFAADVVTYNSENTNFDFVTMMDVLEHIPIERHSELFQNLQNFCDDKTLILINIPNPHYIAYSKIHTPELLQVIDQPIYLPELLKTADNCNFEIIFYEKYSIWEKEDYDFLVLRKKRGYKLEHLSENRNFSEKALKKVSGKIKQIKYS